MFHQREFSKIVVARREGGDAERQVGRHTRHDPDYSYGLSRRRKEQEYVLFVVANHKEVSMYELHDVLVRMTWKEDQSRQHLRTEVRRWRGVDRSLIDCAASLLHGICGTRSDNLLHHALLYHTRSLEVI